MAGNPLTLSRPLVAAYLNQLRKVGLSHVRLQPGWKEKLEDIPDGEEGAGKALWPNGEERARVAATVPLGRLATPEEVAWWAAALCSSYAGYITGEVLTVDGGQWLEQESYLPALEQSGR